VRHQRRGAAAVGRILLGKSQCVLSGKSKTVIILIGKSKCVIIFLAKRVITL
jgi:hypothetical protein